MTKSGSALIISMLLLAVISTAGFGLARLALIELRGSEVEMANQKAYYLAEGGIEEGLLRWRYDHQVEVGSTSRQADKRWEQVDFQSNYQVVSSSQFNQPSYPDRDYQGLTIYNQVKSASGVIPEILPSLIKDNNHLATPDESSAFLTEYIKNRPDLLVNKDNKIIFQIPDKVIPDIASDLKLIWRWHRIANPGSAVADQTWLSQNGDAKFGVEIRFYRTDLTGNDTLLKKAVFSPGQDGLGHNIANSNNFGENICRVNDRVCEINLKTVLGEFANNDQIKVSLTPLNCNIILAAYGLNSSLSIGKEFTDSITHIESLGMSSGRIRGLKTAIDSNSGSVLGLFDYVVFQGQ